MSQITPGYVWDATQNKFVDVASLNKLVGQATLNPIVVSPPTNGATSYVLYLSGGQLYARTWNAFCSGMSPVNSIQFSPVSGNAFKFVAGAGNLLLYESAGTSGYQYPLQVLNGCKDNTLYLNSTGVGVRNAAPAYPLDVTGTARATGCIIRDTIPQLTFDDSSASAYPVALYCERTDGASWLYMSLLPSVGGAASKTPVSLCMDASDNTLVVTAGSKVGIGTASPSEKLAVAGNIAASGSITGVNLAASGAFYHGTDAGLTGTLVVTGTWNGGSSGSRTLSFKGGILTSVT